MIRKVLSCLAIVAISALLTFDTGCDVSGGAGTGGNVIILGPPDPNGGSGCSDAFTTAELADQAVALANVERAQVGAAALVVDPTLQAVAQNYAEAMATQGFIGHTNPNGDSVSERVTDAGYTWIAVGENLAFGPCTAEAAVDGWMNSEGHRANLLYSDFIHTGLGVYRGGTYRMYWVQVFATPR